MTAWVQFALSAAVIAFVAFKMTQYADVIAVRTRLGGMFVGTLLLAAGTSAPEIITNASSVRLGVPNLAAGDLFGSGMFNMLILALMSVVCVRTRILRQVSTSHALTASLATLLTGMAALFVLARIPWHIGWLGLDSLSMILVYVGGIWLIEKESRRSGAPVGIELEVPGIGLKHAGIGFVVSLGVLVAASPWLVRAAKEIALITGLGTVAYAAHQVAINALSVAYMPGFGFALAATTLVGQELGAKRPDRAHQCAHEAVRLATLVMAVMGVLVSLFASQVMGIFVNDAAVIESGAPILRIAGLVMPLLGIGFTFAGGLRGAGDTTAVLVVLGASIWCVRVVGAYLLSPSLGLIGIWIAIGLDFGVRSTLLALRFRSGKWKSIRV